MENKEKDTEQGMGAAVNETGAAPIEQDAASTAATPAVKSKRDTYMEGFKKKHPEWQDDDEEGFYGALSEDDAAMADEMNGYKSREEELSSTLSGSPLNAALFVDAVNGTPIPLSILQRYPEEVKAWIDDPENSAQVEQVFNDLAEKMANNKKLEEEAQKNLEESQAMVEQMIADGELTGEDEANSLIEKLGAMALGISMNKIEKEWMIAAKNAVNHDSDVEAARSAGEIAGRNAKIEAKRNAGSRGTSTHSGLGSSNAGQKLSGKETALATGGGGKKDMWAGMKTNKLS